MKALVTTPAKYLVYSLVSDPTMVFGLAHLAVEKTWRGELYYRQIRHASVDCDAHLIIDNGVTELGKPLGIDVLWKTALICGANEVVLPDEFGDSVKTCEYVRDAIKWLRDGRGATFLGMAVVHSDGIQDLIDTLEEWKDYSEIKVLGIPKRQTESSWWSNGRASILQAIERRGYDNRFEVHMLGVWNDLREVQRIATAFPWVRSIDTSWPVMAGLAGIDVEKKPTVKIPYEADPRNIGVVDAQLISHNIEVYQRWAEHD